jgi:hypothetical protein
MNIDKVVDGILEAFREQDALPIAYDAMDKIYRPFLHWLAEAHSERIDPAVVRHSLIALISSMTMETASRMGEVKPDGTRVPVDEWLGEFILDLRDELIADLKSRMGKAH